MYKIFIKYTSTFNRTYWYAHEIINEEGQTMEFSTTDFEVLKSEINKLNKEIGYKDIRVIQDIDYDINVDVFDDIENVEPVQPEDVANIYQTAFNKIFTEEG